MPLGNDSKFSSFFDGLQGAVQLRKMLSGQEQLDPFLRPGLEKLSPIELLWLIAKIDYPHIPDQFHYLNTKEAIEINFSLIDIRPDNVFELSSLFCVAASDHEKKRLVSHLVKSVLLDKIGVLEFNKYEDLLKHCEIELSETAIQTTFSAAVEALTQPFLTKESQERINSALFRGESVDRTQHKGLFLALHLLPISHDLTQFGLDEVSLRLLYEAESNVEVWQHIKKALINQLGKQGELAHLILTIQTLYVGAFQLETTSGTDSSDHELKTKEEVINSDHKKSFLMMLWSGLIQTDFYDQEIISEQYTSARVLQHFDAIQMGDRLHENISFVRQRPALFQLIQSALLSDLERKELIPFQKSLILSSCAALTPHSVLALIFQLKTDLDPAKMAILKLKKPEGIEQVHFDRLLSLVNLSPEYQKFVVQSLEKTLRDRYPAFEKELLRVTHACQNFLTNYLLVLLKNLSFSSLRWLSMVCQDNRADFQKRIVQSMVIRPDAEIDLGLSDGAAPQKTGSHHNAIIREVIKSYQTFHEAETCAVSENKETQIAGTKIALQEIQCLSTQKSLQLAAIKSALQRSVIDKQKKVSKQADYLRNCLKIILKNSDLMGYLLEEINKKLDKIYQIDLHCMKLMSLAEHYDRDQLLPSVAMVENSIAPLVSIALARKLPITWRQWMLYMCKCLDFSNRPDVKIPGLPPDMLPIISLRLKWPLVREQLYGLFYTSDDNVSYHPQFTPDEALYLPSEEILFDQPDFPIEFNQQLTDKELWMLAESIRSNPQLTIVDLGLMALPENIDVLVDILIRHPHLKIIRGSQDPVKLIDKLIEKVYRDSEPQNPKIDLLIFSLLGNCHKKYGSEIIPKVLSGEMPPPSEMPETDQHLLVRLRRIIRTNPLATLKVNWYCSMASCLAVKDDLIKRGVSAVELQAYSLEDMLEKELLLVMSDLSQQPVEEVPQATNDLVADVTKSSCLRTM
jgi:hypothetical protein